MKNIFRLFIIILLIIILALIFRGCSNWIPISSLDNSDKINYELEVNSIVKKIISDNSRFDLYNSNREANLEVKESVGDNNFILLDYTIENNSINCIDYLRVDYDLTGGLILIPMGECSNPISGYTDRPLEYGDAYFLIYNLEANR